MSLLRPGVSGFCSIDDPEQPTVDLPRFKQACHDIARRRTCRIVSTTPAGETPNFHWARLAPPLWVLCNATYPLIAFSPRQPAPDDLVFIDPPDLTATWAEYGFTVVAASDLEQKLNGVALSGLHESEREQCRYWNPRRVGDVIFNWWD